MLGELVQGWQDHNLDLTIWSVPTMFSCICFLVYTNPLIATCIPSKYILISSSLYRLYTNATNTTMAGAGCSGVCLCAGDILCCHRHHCWDCHSEEEAVK